MGSYPFLNRMAKPKFDVNFSDRSTLLDDPHHWRVEWFKITRDNGQVLRMIPGYVCQLCGDYWLGSPAYARSEDRFCITTHP